MLFLYTGFFKFVATPLISEWHRFLQNDLSTQMLENLLYNQSKWEMLVAQELAEETKTEISETDIIDDEIESCSGTNLSESSELLLPLRRSSLNPTKPSHIKEQLRRFSVPLNVFQDSKFRCKDKGRCSLLSELSELRGKGIATLMGSEHSIHSQLGGQCDSDGDTERLLSSEKLLPDSTIASITTPMQATRLNTVLKEGGTWKLLRQQTFPPLESIARTHALLCRPKYTSNENTIYPKTDITLPFETEKAIHDLFKKERKTEKTGEYDDPSINVPEYSNFLQMDDFILSKFRGQRDENVVGSQLRHNLSAVQLQSAGQLLQRRKSMPADVLALSKFLFFFISILCI